MKRFQIITEADARVLEPGSTVELEKRGHITPLALDTLRERRVNVVRLSGAAEAGGTLAPASNPQSVAIASDHTGIALRKQLVTMMRGQGRRVLDLGTDTSEPVDYPDVAAMVAKAVSRGEVEAGIVIDAAGIGSAMAANKVKGVRAAMCTDETVARYSREHNGANVMTLGSTLLTVDQAKRILETWLGTAMKEPRYIRRLEKIRRLESES